VLRVYTRQIRVLTDYRFHLERAQSLWDESHLVGGDRATQTEAWLHLTEKRMANCEALQRRESGRAAVRAHARHTESRAPPHRYHSHRRF
jgi:hypothetical protein